MIYNQNKINYLLKAKSLTQHVADRSFDALGLEKGMKVLDVGCGLGQDVHIMQNRYGVEATGIDQDTEVIKYACDNHNGSFHLGNMNDLYNTPMHWDAIRSERVFQHLKYPTQAMKAFHYGMKDGGTLCIIDTVWHSVKVPRLRLLNQSHIALTRHALIQQYVSMTATKGLSDPISSIATRCGFTCKSFDLVEVRASNLKEANQLFDFENTLLKARESEIINDNELENALAQALILDSKGEFFMSVQMEILIATK